MNTDKLKSLINTLLANVDDKEVLKEIYDLLKSKTNVLKDPQVSYVSKSKVSVSKRAKTKDEDYTKPGKPMSMEEFNKRINEALANVDAGNFTTQEDLEKQMEEW